MGEDLTPQEQANLNTIKGIIQPYWGVSRVLSTQFARDRLKCQLDGHAGFVRLTVDEVERYVRENRIKKLLPKNGGSGSS